MPTNKNIFILGTSISGPLNQPVLIDSLDEAKEVFGGRFSETFILSSTTAEVWLAYRAKKGSIRPYTISGNRLVPYKLYNTKRDSTNHNRITFDPAGVDALPSGLEIVFSYDREYEENEVLKFYEESMDLAVDANVYLVRIAGSTSSVGVLDEDSNLLLTIYGKYPGAVYNQIAVVASATQLTFTFPNGLCSSNTRTYSLTSTKTIQDLANEINAHSSIGLNAVYASPITGTTPVTFASTSIAAGTYTLSGGEDRLALDVANFTDPDGNTYDSFTNSLITTLSSITGLDGDVITCPLPFFLKRYGMNTRGISCYAYDWDDYEFFGHNEEFILSGTRWDTTPNTFDWVMTIPNEDDGGLSIRANVGDGLYQITAPTSITKGSRIITFKYWVIYGTALGATFLAERSKYACIDNPVQILHAGKEVVAVAVYSNSSSIYRSISLPGVQGIVQTANDGWNHLQTTTFTNQYDLATLGRSLNQYISAERQNGKVPLFILPTLEWRMNSV